MVVIITVIFICQLHIYIVDRTIYIVIITNTIIVIIIIAIIAM